MFVTTTSLMPNRPYPFFVSVWPPMSRSAFCPFCLERFVVLVP